VSSILDALAKIEAAGARPEQKLLLAVRPRRSARRVIALAVVIAFAVGVGTTAWLLRGRTPEPVAAEKPATPPAEVATAAPPAAATAPAPSAPVAVATASAPAATAPPPPTPAPPTAAPVPAAVATAPTAAAPAPVAAPSAAVAAPTAPVAAPPLPASAAPAATAPRAVPEVPVARAAVPEPAAAPFALEKPPKVHLSFLAYSPRTERRSVSLTIEGGSLVVLHEGESADGVEVARILPDHVELRSGGRTFSVGTR
jgi:cytoskeletal protein RodZ